MKHSRSHRMKYVDVKRKIQMSIHSVSKQYYQWYMDQSQRCQIFLEELTGTTRFQIPHTRLPEGNKCGEAGRPTNYPRRNKSDQTVQWPECLDKNLPSWKKNETPEESARYGPMTEDDFKVTADARLDTATGDTAPAKCRALGGQTVEGNLRPVQHATDACTEPSDSEEYRSMRKSEPKTRGPHCRKRVCGKHSPWLATRSSFLFKKRWRLPDARAAHVRKSGTIKEHASMGSKEGEIKGRSRPSGEEGWKNSSLREVDGTSVDLKNSPNLQNTSRNTRGAVVLTGATTSKTMKDTEHYSRSKVLQRLRWQRQLFLDTVSKPSDALSAYTQVKTTEAPRLLRLPEEECPWECGSGFLHDKDQPIEIMLTILWYLLKGISNGLPSAGLLWERKIWRGAIWKTDGKKYQHGNVLSWTNSSEYSCRFVWTI